MSLFNRKTVLDNGIESLKINCMDLFDEITDFHQKFPDPLDVWGGAADEASEVALNAAQVSADAMLQSTDKNIDFQKWLWGEQTALQQPYMDAGEGALPQYQEMMNEPIDITSDPSYQFRLNEGRKAYENSASAKGSTLSGAQAKALNRYGSDFASQEYGAAFNRRQQSLDNLYRMVNLGQSAASGTAQSGTSMGSSVSNSIGTAGQSLSDMYTNMGNIQAANIQGTTNRNMDIAGGVLSFFSDNRLKENITKIGIKNGLNLYSWTWNKIAKQFGLTGDSYGVIAQEVMKEKPNAVITDSGYLKVNYSLLGINHGS